MLAQIILSVLKRKKYATIAIILAILMAVISYALTIISVAKHSLITLIQMDGVMFTIVSLILSLIISILFGAHISLSIFRRNLFKNEKDAKNTLSGIGEMAGTGAITGMGGVGGTFTGMLATACPSCGAPILGLFGAPLALMSLPFHGLEIKVLSIIILIVSAYLLLRSIEKRIKCSVTA